MNVYLIGGGIASLAGAVFLIRDGHVPPEKITILEERDILGGSLDGRGSPETGYSARGGRMFNFTYYCTYDMLSAVPSLSDLNRTVREEIIEFNNRIKTNSHCRLVEAGHIVDSSRMGFDLKDRFELSELIVLPEDAFWGRQIDDFFSPAFFETNFWFMWASMFAFQPWHSLVEFRRYLHRFIHEFPRINTLAGVDRTPYNQYDSIIRPVAQWLRGQGVRFQMECQVTDVDFCFADGEKTAETIHFLQGGTQQSLSLTREDLLFVTLGCMTEGSDLGSMTKPPALKSKRDGGAWALWENIARKHPDFGNPSAFDDDIEASKWESFTVTLRDPTFFRLMQEFSGNEAGTGGLVTFKDSNWLLSIVLAHQPHFIGQPEDVYVFWGYSLFGDKPGNFVKKGMSECSGEEILVELLHHLGFEAEMPKILESANCIPCMMPFITSFFLKRSKGDRPQLIPEGATNFAFLGQYCEMPDDVVFTVEYSVRAAQTAVYSLLKLDKQAPAMYKGTHDIGVLWNAIKTMTT